MTGHVESDADSVRELIAFLQSADMERTTKLGQLSRSEAQLLLQRLIVAEIQVRGKSNRKIQAVLSAPHAGFDHWSEYYCNRLAPALNMGWVVALNFRDQDHLRIPVSIGRHVHVNRPTESSGPGQRESRTERAEKIFSDYATALREAATHTGDIRIDLLIELHSHKHSDIIEIATTGIDASEARLIKELYADVIRGENFPELKIEPLDNLYWRAERAKSEGILRPEYVRRGLHVELPRGLRNSEQARVNGVKIMQELFSAYLTDIESKL